MRTFGAPPVKESLAVAQSAFILLLLGEGLSMPPRFRMTSTATGSIETGNKLGARPVIRQSAIYRETMSGNAVKGLMGHTDILWDTERQEGCFRGMPVHTLAAAECPGKYQAARGAAGETIDLSQRVQNAPHTLQALPAPADTYPNPGSQATCDGCGAVTYDFFHCSECAEPALFDLCPRCFRGLYEHRGAPMDLARLRRVPAQHPQHDFSLHQMAHVVRP